MSVSEKPDLGKKSLVELREILNRQEKLCQNKKLLQTLPDKGARIFDTYNKVKDAIAQVEEVENTANLLDKLSFGEKVITGSVSESSRKENETPTAKLYFGDRLVNWFHEKVGEDVLPEESLEKNMAIKNVSKRQWEEFPSELINKPTQLVSLKESIACITQQTSQVKTDALQSAQQLAAKYRLPVANHDSDDSLEETLFEE